MVALLEDCDVTNNGRHLARHLGFYQELEIRLKPREMLLFVRYKILAKRFTFIVEFEVTAGNRTQDLPHRRLRTNQLC